MGGATEVVLRLCGRELKNPKAEKVSALKAKELIRGPYQGSRSEEWWKLVNGRRSAKA